jgi:hypothetical protein
LTITKNGDGEAVGTAIVSTLIGCSSGGIVVLFVTRFLPGGGKCWNLSKTVNGCIAGKSFKLSDLKSKSNTHK